MDLDPDRGLTRGSLQRLGIRLEAERPGRWLIEAAVASPRPVVVDAAKTKAQVEVARALLHACLVVHLKAPARVRRSRFESRADPTDLGVGFADLRASGIEKEAEALWQLADVVVDSRQSPAALLELVVAATERHEDG